MSGQQRENRALRRADQAIVRRWARKRSRRPLAQMIRFALSIYDPESTSENALPDRPLPLETIDAMASLVESRGRIVRSHAACQDRTTPRCPKCSRFAAKPMSAEEARLVRRVIEVAKLDDAVAFAFVKTNVLVTGASRESMCDCDLRAWTAAIDEYTRGSEAAWRAIGVAT